ncbi:MAG: penicillin-binding protein 2 [Chloroflexi bacterium]|nr:penicillin-binding protein 2 [Chloroflexota bacterium]MBU1751618.1 penicillin-binding protein 2 [Chloroflexota bacterium]
MSGIPAYQILDQEYRRRRLRLLPLAVAFVLGAILLVSKLGYWQLQEHTALAAQAQDMRLYKEVIAPRRGRIFDRNGYTLAINAPCVRVTAAPQQIEDPAGTADRLALLLNMPRSELLQALQSDELWVSLSRHVPYETATRIDELGLPGIYMEEETQREYPTGALAAHVVGIVTWDGKGYYGIEGAYDRLLRGVAGTLTSELASDKGMTIAGTARDFAPARDGADLYLSLDRAVQRVAEEELARGLQEFGSDSGSILVVNPRTGEILAMASHPIFNPDDFAELPPEQFVNPAISAQYEPGSVFKLVTMAAALDTGVLGPNDSFYCTGEIAIGGRILRPWDRKAHGQETMTEVLAHSCNVGAAYAATQVGADEFYRYVFDFGFARPSDVELQGEVKGRVLLPGEGDWYPINLGTNAFGQGLAVTPLQMTMAVATIANDGVRMRPQIISRVVQPDYQIVSEPTAMGRVIKSESARQLTEMMVTAIEAETELARVPGYRVAGKTGTAQIPTPDGYDPQWTIASFVGFLPASDPQLVILVKIDRPSVDPWGSKVAAPIFSRVAQRLVVLLGIPPDDQRAN